jgi:HAD superfamily hydrolase (TIGR01509 family)
VPFALDHDRQRAGENEVDLFLPLVPVDAAPLARLERQLVDPDRFDAQGATQGDEAFGRLEVDACGAEAVGHRSLIIVAGVVTALIFDLDGTLVDTVYAHVFAWQRALEEMGMPIDGWRIHRRIGMSGGLFARAVAREVGRPLDDPELEAVQRRHGQLFRELLPERRPLPGAVELLQELREREVVHGIATSGRRPEIDASLEVLGVGPHTVVVERGDVARAKPEPDLFIECARRLDVEPDECYVVGDAVWDLLAARRAKMLSVGVLSGGYGEDELDRAGAFRVYRDAAELRDSLDELGVVP